MLQSTEVKSRFSFTPEQLAEYEAIEVAIAGSEFFKKLNVGPGVGSDDKAVFKGILERVLSTSILSPDQCIGLLQKKSKSSNTSILSYALIIMSGEEYAGEEGLKFKLNLLNLLLSTQQEKRNACALLLEDNNDGRNALTFALLKGETHLDFFGAAIRFLRQMVQEGVVSLEEVHECMRVENKIDKALAMKDNASFIFLVKNGLYITKNQLDILLEWIASGLVPQDQIQKLIVEFPDLAQDVEKVNTIFDLQSSNAMTILQGIRELASQPDAGNFAEVLQQFSLKFKGWPLAAIDYLRAAAIAGFMSAGHVASAEALLPYTSAKVRQAYALTDASFVSSLKALDLVQCDQLAGITALQAVYEYASQNFLLGLSEVDELVSSQSPFNQDIKRPLIQALKEFIETTLWKHQKSRFNQFVADCERASTREKFIELLQAQSAVPPSFGMKDAILGVKQIVDQCLNKLGIDPASSSAATSPAASAADRFSQPQESALQKQSVFVSFAAKVKQTFGKQSVEEKLAAMEQCNDELFQL